MLRKIFRLINKIRLETVRSFKKTVPIYIPVLQSNLLKNRGALITGGSSGIGFAIANAFLRSGAHVVITGRNTEKLENACKELKKLNPENDNIYGIYMDNSDIPSLSNKFEQVIKLLNDKKLNILVNNAGFAKGGAFSTISNQDFSDVIDTNLKGTFFISQIAAKYMKNNNIHGNILNIASSSSLRPAVSPYTISKWGIRGLTQGLAKLLIPYGIVVNGIAPGPTATPFLITDGYDGIENNLVPAGRFATAEEIANMSVILVSDMGKMIVGDIVFMTGGSGITTIDDMKYEF